MPDDALTVGWCSSLLNCSPVTVLRTQTAFPTSSAFSWSSSSAVAPFWSVGDRHARRAILARLGARRVYQIGELQARSCTVGGTTSGGAMPS